VGTKKVKGNPHLGQQNPDLIKQYGGGSFGGGIVKPNSGYSDADGNEEVDAWECAKGCPVGAIDEQSGELNTQKVRTNPAAESKDGGMFGIAKKHERKEYLGDTGGASRFFKQVGRYDDNGTDT
jgi:hypothetical protein